MKKKYLKDLVLYQKEEIEKLKQTLNNSPKVAERRIIIQLSLNDEHVSALCEDMTEKQFNELWNTHINKEHTYITAIEMQNG